MLATTFEFSISFCCRFRWYDRRGWNKDPNVDKHWGVFVCFPLIILLIVAGLIEIFWKLPFGIHLIDNSFSGYFNGNGNRISWETEETCWIIGTSEVNWTANTFLVTWKKLMSTCYHRAILTIYSTWKCEKWFFGISVSLREIMA